MILGKRGYEMKWILIRGQLQKFFTNNVVLKETKLATIIWVWVFAKKMDPQSW